MRKRCQLEKIADRSVPLIEQEDFGMMTVHSKLTLRLVINVEHKFKCELGTMNVNFSSPPPRNDIVCRIALG